MIFIKYQCINNKINRRIFDKKIESEVDNKKSKTINNLLKNKTILITGGAGSICSVLVKKLLEYPVQSIRVLDIDEHALFRLNRTLKDKRIRLLLGNVLDKERVERAVQGADVVIHAAAVKNIEITEFNPIETIDINIQGTVNLIQMAIKNKPKIFLLDVDGVMTNGQFIYSSQGKKFKIFGPDDHDALSLLKPFLEIRFLTGDKKGFKITQKRIVNDMKFPLNLHGKLALFHL